MQRYVKNRIFHAPAKIISQNKDYFFVIIKKIFLPLQNKRLTAYPEGYREMI